MKKLLLLAGILAISGAAFSAGVEAELEVKAQIVKPLTLTTEPVDFGILVAGQTGLISTRDGIGKNGKILLSGGAKENVLLKVEGFDAVGTGGSNIYLTNVNDTNSKLVATLGSTDGGNGHGNNSSVNLSKLFNTPFSLGEDGSLEFPVYGILQKGVPADATPGQYTGTVKITADYEFNSGK